MPTKEPSVNSRNDSRKQPEHSPLGQAVIEGMKELQAHMRGEIELRTRVIHGPDKLKPYPEYKESSLPWLNRLPAHWSLLRGKGAFFAVDVRSKTGKEELLTVSSADGVIPRRQKTVTKFMAKSYVGHKLCWPSDLVINSLWAWMQGLGVAQHHGLISSAYSVYRPRQEFREYARFFHYLLRSAAYKWELQTRSKGVWLSRLQLSDLAFMDMPILLPPPDEQAAIVRFLDWANARLERAIRAKRKVIALLPYTNAAWEKLSIFLDHLIRKLPTPVEEDLSKGILEAIDMDSYRAEKQAAMRILLPDADAEIGPVPTEDGGRKPDTELDRLSSILNSFNEKFGTLFTDADRVAKRIKEEIAPKVAADPAYQNAKKNTPNTARIELDAALKRVVIPLLKDDTEFFKQFMQNESFRRFVTDTVGTLTGSEPGTQ